MTEEAPSARVAGRIVQLNVSRGGVPKRPVAEAQVGERGLEGDTVAHTRIHGGPTRAVCLYAMERIRALQAEGASVFPGALGENVTLEGLDWDAIVPGARLALGDEVVLEVTKYTTPCAATAPYVGGDMTRYHQDHRPGWSRVYARVVRGGRLAPGMTARVIVTI